MKRGPLIPLALVAFFTRRQSRNPASSVRASRNPRLKGKLLCALAFFAVASHAAAEQQQPLSMTASAAQLTIMHVTRGGRAVLAGMSIRAEGGGVRRVRRFAEILIDADGNGEITYLPDGKVPLRSIWVAIDLQTGATATAGGPQLASFVRPFPEDALKKDVAGHFDTAGRECGDEIASR